MFCIRYTSVHHFEVDGVIGQFIENNVTRLDNSFNLEFNGFTIDYIHFDFFRVTFFLYWGIERIEYYSEVFLSLGWNSITHWDYFKCLFFDFIPTNFSCGITTIEETKFLGYVHINLVFF